MTDIAEKRAASLRETLIMAKALAYAIKVIEALPKHWQEWSDKEDMKVILQERFSPVWQDLAKQSADHHLDGFQREVNINAAISDSQEKQ